MLKSFLHIVPDCFRNHQRIFEIDKTILKKLNCRKALLLNPQNLSYNSIGKKRPLSENLFQQMRKTADSLIKHNSHLD